MLESLAGGGEHSLADLAKRTGLQRGKLRQHLARLVDLEYAAPVDGKAMTFRAGTPKNSLA